jgi:hypothetical protein
MPRKHSRLPESLIILQQELEQWRTTQPPRSKLPPSLWESAVVVARQCGVYTAAKALRLDYRGLKKRVLGSEVARRKPKQPAFVELIARPAARAEDYVVEFESPRGSKMRVQWKANAPPDWPSLLRAWSDTEK